MIFLSLLKLYFQIVCFRSRFCYLYSYVFTYLTLLYFSFIVLRSTQIVRPLILFYGNIVTCWCWWLQETMAPMDFQPFRRQPRQRYVGKDKEYNDNMCKCYYLCDFVRFRTFFRMYSQLVLQKTTLAHFQSLIAVWCQNVVCMVWFYFSNISMWRLCQAGVNGGSSYLTTNAAWCNPNPTFYNKNNMVCIWH